MVSRQRSAISRRIRQINPHKPKTKSLMYHVLTLLSTTATTSRASPTPTPTPHTHALRAHQRACQLTALAHQGGRSVGANKRVRHHVNPLRSNHQNPLELADAWTRDYYQIPTNPLHVDIGCARGVFSKQLQLRFRR